MLRNGPKHFKELKEFPNFASNIKQILQKQLTFIPLEIDVN